MYLNFSSCFPCPVDENVIDFSPPEPPKPRHRSQFAPKVRVERWCCKSGRHQTIGPPPLVCRPQPQDFLKKHSRLPPVFFDSEDLKSHPKPKPKTPPPPRRKYKPTKGGVGGVGEKCAYPQPPKDMGLFRAPDDPSYESTFRINKPAHQQGFCCSCETSPVPLCTCVDCCGAPNFDDDVCGSGCPCGNPNCCFFIPEEPHEQQQQQQRRPKKPGRKSKNPEERDFLQENALNVVRMSCSRRPKFYVDECGAFTLDLRQDASKQGPFVLKPDYGQVPKYLEKRKEEPLQEEQSGCSFVHQKRSSHKKHSRKSGEVPGCRQMEEIERAALMTGIRQTRDKLKTEYLELLKNSGEEEEKAEEGGGAKVELEELESKIKEAEGDLKLLSSPQEIFVEKSTEAEDGEEVLLFHS